MYEKLNVRIKSIIPNDKFNVVGKKGYIYKDLVEVDNRLLIIIGNKELRTSLIKSVTETADEIEVKTMNSVYTLEKIKEEF
jgi:hypothetical protein